MLERLRRKRDQAWEMAGCARQDRDKADEKRWTDEAIRLSKEIKLLIGGKAEVKDVEHQKSEGSRGKRR